MLQNLNGNNESSESASPSSLGSNNSTHNKAPGSHLHQKGSINQLNLSSATFVANVQQNSLVNSGLNDFTPELTKQVRVFGTIFTLK